MNVLAFDYRGYGNSEGSPSEDGLILDGLAALSWLKQKKNVDATYIFGRSLGGAVWFALWEAVHGFADENKAKYPKLEGLIIENTFTSIPELVDKIFPWMKIAPPIKNYFLRLSWNTMARMDNIDPNLNWLFLIGEQDELIPPRHGQDLKAKMKNGKVALFPTGMHNDTYMKGGEAYWSAICQFLRETSSISYKH